MKNKQVLPMVQAALIAAMYVVLTWLANIFGLANGAIQVRFSEALTILPYFTPAAIPGLFVGCVISNTITGAAVWDILFGSLATLIGAFFTYKLRHISKWLAPLPPILECFFCLHYKRMPIRFFNHNQKATLIKWVRLFLITSFLLIHLV